MKDFEDTLKVKLQYFDNSIKAYGNMHKADPAILYNLKVAIDLGSQELKKIASIVAGAGGRELRVTPFDQTHLKPIASALIKSELGNVSDLKHEILLTLRPLTEEYKEKIKKEVKELGNKTKESMRQARNDFLNKIKKQEKSEDERKRKEKEVQNLLDKQNRQVEDLIAAFVKR